MIIFKTAVRLNMFRVQAGKNGNTGGGYFGKPDFGISTKASYTLFDGGAVSSNIEKNEHALAETNARVDSVRNRIAFETIKAALQVSRNQRLLQVTKERVATIQNYINMLTEITKADVGRRSEIDLAKTREGLAINQEQGIRITLDRESQSLQRYAGNRAVVIAKKIQGNAEDIPVKNMDALKDAFAESAAMKEANAKIKVVEADLRIRQARQRYPSVALQVQYAPRQQQDLPPQPKVMWGINANWDIFSGWSSIYLVQSAAQMIESAIAGKE